MNKQSAPETHLYSKAILIGLILLLGIFFAPKAGAETTPDSATSSGEKAPVKILFVYDSLAINNGGSEAISTLERLLTSFNVEVKTQAIDDYYPAELTNFTGLITMINAPDLAIENQDFIKDREAYQGLKLHIGGSLPASWQSQLGIQLQEIIGERFTLSSTSNKASEVREEAQTLEAAKNLPEGAREFGTLDFENQMELASYGVLNQQIAYLPYFTSSGLSLILTSQLLQEWLAKADPALASATYHPILVFTGVTPFSNLPLLKYLADEMYNAGIPFAISGTSVWQNTELKAMGNYMEALQYVAARNGSFILQTPEPRGLNQEDKVLRDVMTTTINKLVEKEVYPIALSTPAYWNRETYYQENGLSYSDTLLLLPNPKNYQLQLGPMTAQSYQTAYFGLPAAKLSQIEWTSQSRHQFSSPTALTYEFPATGKELAELEKQIQQLPVLFRGMSLTDSQLATSSYLVEVINGVLTVNGERRYAQTAAKSETTQDDTKKSENQGSLAGFFNFQDRILMVIILGTLFVLAIFFVVGYNLYRGKYRK